MRNFAAKLSERVPFACVCSVDGVVNEHIDLRVTGTPFDGQSNASFTFHANGKDNMTLSEVRSKFRVLEFSNKCNVFYTTSDGRFISLNRIISNTATVDKKDLPAKDTRDVGTAFKDDEIIRMMQSTCDFSSCKLLLQEGMTLKISDETNLRFLQHEVKNNKFMLGTDVIFAQGELRHSEEVVDNFDDTHGTFKGNFTIGLSKGRSFRWLLVCSSR